MKVFDYSTIPKFMKDHRICKFVIKPGVKVPNDKHHWIVKETAANVVHRIFKLCVDEYGPSQIAGILEKDKFLVPSAYYKSIGVSYSGKVPDNPYAWQSRTATNILAHPEYLGHTVNSKTYIYG